MFVVFEGIDGSGKTTVSNLVVQRLQARGLSVKHLRAEGKFVSSVSEAIRSLARDSRNVELDPRSEFLLYVARDVQLIEEALRDALRTHDVVLADRFLYTAEVLGRYGRGLPIEYTKPILEAAAGGLSPDLVVLIDVDPVLARARRKSSKLVVKDQRPPSRKGLAGVGLQHRVRRGYLELRRRSRAVRRDQRRRARRHRRARVTALVSEARRDGTPTALDRFRDASSARRRAAAANDARRPASPADALPVFSSSSSTSAWSGSPASPRTCSAASRDPASTNDGGCWRAGPRRGGRRAHRVDRRREASNLREQLSAVAPAAVARSLEEVPSDNARAAALRVALEPIAPVDVALSLNSLDDEAAWQARERLFEIAAPTS